MVSINDIAVVRAATAYCKDGNKVGRVGDVYVDDLSNEPAWVTLTAGLFGTKTLFAPLAGSRLDGDRLVLAYGKDVINGAPAIADSGHISEAEQQALIEYFTRHAPVVAAAAAPVVAEAADTVVMDATAPAYEGEAPLVAAADAAMIAPEAEVVVPEVGVDAHAPMYQAPPAVDPSAVVEVPVSDHAHASVVEVPENLVDTYRSPVADVVDAVEAPVVEAADAAMIAPEAEVVVPEVGVDAHAPMYQAPPAVDPSAVVEVPVADPDAPAIALPESLVDTYRASYEPAAAEPEVGPFDAPYAAPAKQESWELREATSWDAPAPIRSSALDGASDAVAAGAAGVAGVGAAAAAAAGAPNAAAVAAAGAAAPVAAAGLTALLREGLDKASSQLAGVTDALRDGLEGAMAHLHGHEDEAAAEPVAEPVAEVVDAPAAEAVEGADAVAEASAAPVFANAFDAEAAVTEEDAIPVATPYGGLTEEGVLYEEAKAGIIPSATDGPLVVDATAIAPEDVEASADEVTDLAQPGWQGEDSWDAAASEVAVEDAAPEASDATVEGEWGAEPVEAEADHHLPASGVLSAPVEGDTAAQEAHSGSFRMHPSHTRETIYRDSEGNILYSIIHKFEDIFGKKD